MISFMTQPVFFFPGSIYEYNRRKVSLEKNIVRELHTAFCRAQLILDSSLFFAKEWYQKKRENLLLKPPPEGFKSARITPISPSFFEVSLSSLGYASARGGEKCMEDEATVGTIFLVCEKKTAYVAYFILLDGDRGSECARFLEEQIPLYLKKRLQKIPSLKDENKDLEIINSLKLLGPRLNQSYARYRWRQESSSLATSTALVCLLHERTLYTANIGDSRAIFVSSTKIVALSEDANPTIPKYRIGVEKRGGRVVWQDAKKKWVVQHDRLQETPTVARSIGYNESHSGINPRATVTKIKLTDKGHFVMASKGIWSALTCEQVAAWIRCTLVEKPKQPAQVFAATLVRLAHSEGTPYNRSVLVIEFSPLSS